MEAWDPPSNSGGSPTFSIHAITFARTLLDPPQTGNSPPFDISWVVSRRSDQIKTLFGLARGERSLVGERNGGGFRRRAVGIAHLRAASKRRRTKKPADGGPKYY